ncbi:MAG: hypothetical protein WC712_11120 [Candidatus Brocadiia bacterium]
MKWRNLGEAYLLVASALLTAVAVVAFPQTPAQAESLAITGARLKLVQGSPEDMMRYPFYSYSGGDDKFYPSPRSGDIVQIEATDAFYARQESWPRITVFWEAFGSKADFDIGDHFGYVDGRVFALLLSNAATWQWLEKATDAELAGVRYVEIQGVPPANFAPLIEKLPKKKIVVLCGEWCFPSMTDAIAPLEPLGLILKKKLLVSSLDLHGFPSCTYLSVECEGISELLLPPALEVLRISTGWGVFGKVSGAESSLKSASFSEITKFIRWLPAYRALKDLSVTTNFYKESDYVEFTQVPGLLPELRSLRFPAEQHDISFLSGLKDLRSLWLFSRQTGFAPLTDLAKLEYLRIEQWADCDFSALFALKDLKYFALLISPGEDRTVLDLAALEPMAGKVIRLGFSSMDGRLRLVNPEAIAAFTSLENLSFAGYRVPDIPIDSIASLINLRRITGLFVPNRDISPLAKLPHLEYLSLESDDTIDLTGLKNCAALRELSVWTPERLNLEPLASMASLTSLYLTTGYYRGNETDTDCAPLANLKGLQHLSVSITGLKSVEFLGSLPSLSTLTISGYAGADLKVIGALESLHSLSVAGCRDLESLDSIRLPESLRSLELHDLPSLGSLAFLDGAASLVSCRISMCPRVKAIPKLSAPLPRLTSIRVMDCDEFEDTSGLASMPAIETLELNQFEGTEIVGFDALSSLRYVYIDRFTHLESIPKAAPGAPIMEARFEGEPTLWSIEGFETWRELRRLDLRLGRSTPDLFYLEALTKLDYLRLVGGDLIVDVSSLAKMTWLRRLELMDCPFCTLETIELLKKALPGCTVSGNALH